MSNVLGTVLPIDKIIELAKKFNVPVPKGEILLSKDNIAEAAKNVSDNVWVVKAQIHAGGRGAGFFKDEETGGGGVTLATSIEDVQAIVKRMLIKTDVTKQTGIQGKEVTTVYIEEACEIDNEFYLSMLVDRKLGGVTIICSTEGGMEIEEVAESKPEKIIHVNVDSYTGLKSFHVQKISKELGLSLIHI